MPDDGRTKRLPPMKENIYSRSRRRTPWTDKASVTPLESFLDSHAAEEYSRRHPKISETVFMFIAAYSVMASHRRKQSTMDSRII